MTELTVPSSVKNIDDFAFEGCTRLDIIISRNTKFEEKSFLKCSSVKEN